MSTKILGGLTLLLLAASLVVAQAPDNRSGSATPIVPTKPSTQDPPGGSFPTDPTAKSSEGSLTDEPTDPAKSPVPPLQNILPGRTIPSNLGPFPRQNVLPDQTQQSQPTQPGTYPQQQMPVDQRPFPNSLRFPQQPQDRTDQVNGQTVDESKWRAPAKGTGAVGGLAPETTSLDAHKVRQAQPAVPVRTGGNDMLPRKHGQEWRQYDISVYTK